jgi:hypothetical protein
VRLPVITQLNTAPTSQFCFGFFHGFYTFGKAVSSEENYFYLEYYDVVELFNIKMQRRWIINRDTEVN